MDSSALTSPTHTDDDPGTVGELLPLIDVVVVAGPPVAFIAVPWLLFGLMLAAPFAAVVALLLVAAAATLALVAIGALLASPFLLVRHLRHHPIPRPAASPAIRFSRPRLWPAGV